MNPDLAEIIDTQDTIIRMQSQIIDKLFLQLLQYVSADELDNCGIVQEINTIARLSA